VSEPCAAGKARAKRRGVSAVVVRNFMATIISRCPQENGGRRIINETEATLGSTGISNGLSLKVLSTNAITYRLRALNAPSKSGKVWSRRSVQAILKNPAYIGKTYAFTCSQAGKKFARPREDWIEIPNVNTGYHYSGAI